MNVARLVKFQDYRCGSIFGILDAWTLVERSLLGCNDFRTHVTITDVFLAFAYFRSRLLNRLTWSNWDSWCGCTRHFFLADGRESLSFLIVVGAWSDLVVLSCMEGRPPLNHKWCSLFLLFSSTGHSSFSQSKWHFKAFFGWCRWCIRHWNSTRTQSRRSVILRAFVPTDSTTSVCCRCRCNTRSQGQGLLFLCEISLLGVDL